jgi:uncharacterized protein (DUF1501 family)
MKSRRQLLRELARCGGGLLLPVGRCGIAFADLGPERPGPRLVVLFLRGAVDGLNVVVPYGDPRYAAARPTIALGKPGDAGGCLDLDGHFGLHPALEPLMPYWQGGRLAFVHASGSPDPTRSHFEAQDFMESASLSGARLSDGWMNRVAGVLPGPHAPSEALALGASMPRILAGANPVATVALGRGAGRPAALDRAEVGRGFDAMYANTPDEPLRLAYQQARLARSEIMSDLWAAVAATSEMRQADNGAPPPQGFALDAAQLAQILRRDASVRLAFLALGGWDTHVNQGAARGQLANHLRPLGEGLVALAQGLGPMLDDTVVVVVSEFGRTVRQNGNNGTDHGHGNVLWLLGGRIAGGHVYGEWPGLEDAALYQQRDLDITTDYRSVLRLLGERHLQLSDAALAQVFPRAPRHLNRRLSALLPA